MLTDFPEIRHVLFEIFHGSGTRSLSKKLNQFEMVVFQLQVPLEVFKAISMRCKRENNFNSFDKSFLAI